VTSVTKIRGISAFFRWKTCQDCFFLSAQSNTTHAVEATADQTTSRRIIRCTFRQYYQRVAKFSAILTGSFWAASEPAQHQQKPWVMFARFK